MKKSTVKSAVPRSYGAVVIGASAGGISALQIMLAELPDDFALPIIIVQHIHRHSKGYLVKILARRTSLIVKQLDDKEPIKSGYVYLAPADYHTLIEPGYSFALSIDPPVNFSRPSIDVLFESAAAVYRERLIGVVLTGSNRDGSAGLACIKEYGGYAIAQDPDTSEAPSMPEAAIARADVDDIMDLRDIGQRLVALSKTTSGA